MCSNALVGMKTCFRRIAYIIVSLCFFSIGSSHAAANSEADKDTRTFRKQYTIYFRINSSDIDTAFLGNGSTIRRMRREIDSLIARGVITTDSISIVSAASPDGSDRFNITLSRERGRAARSLLKRHYPGINPEIIFVDPIGEDWDTFRKIVREDRNIPGREKLAGLLESGLDSDEKERRLRHMDTTFRYILEHHVYLMRTSAVTFNISMPRISLEEVERPRVPGLEITYTDDFRYRRFPGERPAGKKMILAARTNLLVPVLNVGIEIPVGYSWSVGADYYFPWWLAKDNRHCMEMLGWFLDTKYWFGKDRQEKDKLTGHAIGFYAGFGYYDYQWLRSGNQGEYLDIGADYTWSVPMAGNRLRMEFNIGLGWIYTVARHYTPTDDYSDLIRDPGIRHRSYHFFGPTRASVSLVVPIRANCRKGGGK